MLRLSGALRKPSFTNVLAIGLAGVSRGRISLSYPHIERTRSAIPNELFPTLGYSVRWGSKLKQKEESRKKELSEEQRESLEKNFIKIKKLFESYWYIAIPVHVALTAGWVGIFYTMAKSGLNVVAILKYFNVDEEIIGKAEQGVHSHSSLILLTLLLMKLSSPLRYAVSLLVLRFLITRDYFKPKRRRFVDEAKNLKLSKPGLKGNQHFNREKRNQDKNSEPLSGNSSKEKTKGKINKRLGS